MNHDAKVEMIDHLIGKGLDAKVLDKEGRNLLHIECGRWTLVPNRIAFLLKKGVDANNRPKDGRTPLILMFDNSHPTQEAVEMLLAKGADPFAKDNAGNTVFDYYKYPKSPKEVTDTVERFAVERSTAPRALFERLLARLKENPGDGPYRRMLVRVTARVKPLPPIPEEARRQFIEASTIVKASKSPAQMELAVTAFNKALEIAPWWSEAYYNLAVAQELANRFDDAEKTLNLYLQMISSPVEKRKIQDKLYALSAKKKLAAAGGGASDSGGSATNDGDLIRSLEGARYPQHAAAHFVIRSGAVVTAVDLSKAARGTVFECGGRKIRQADNPGWFECAADAFPIIGRSFTTPDGRGVISADGASMQISYVDEDTGKTVQQTLYKR